MRARTAIAVFVLLAAIHTWPLSVAPWRLSLNYNADAEQAAWTVSWIARTIVRDPLHLFDGNIFAPERRTLAYSDPLIVPSLIAAPIRWLGGSAVFAFNVSLLAGLVLTAWSGWLLAVRWTGAPVPSLVAGALTAFNPHILSRLPHLMAAHLWGVPLTAYCADRLLDDPSRRRAVVLALVVFATAATSLYWLALAGLVVGATMVAGAAARRWKSVVIIGTAALAGVALALPILLPYVRLASTGATRPLEIVAQFAATPAGYLAATSRLHAGWTAPFFRDEVNVFFAGVTAIALGAWGLAAATSQAATRRRALTLAALAAIGFVLSLGPATGFYRWLYGWFPPLQGLRAPARFGYLVLLTLAIGAAFALQRLTGPRQGRTAASVAAVALGAVTLETTQAPIRVEPFDRVPPIYDLVASEPEPVLLVESPFFPADAVFENGEYQLNSTAHWRPLMNGTSGYTPMSYRRRALGFWFFPAPGTVDLMRAEGATHLMVHLERFDDRERRTVTQALQRPPAGLRLLAADRQGHRLYAIEPATSR